MQDKNTVAIVGGRGYLGQALLAYCLSKNMDAWIVGRQSATAVIPVGQRSFYRSSQPNLIQAISGATIVVHLATVSTPALGEQNPLLDLENIAFTLSLIKACQEAHTRHCIFVSSGGTVYGESTVPVSEESPTRPICSYAIAKVACESYLAIAAQAGVMDVTVMRCSNVFGGNQVKKGDQGVVGYIAQSVLRDQKITLFGDTIRDYIYIDDVLSAFDRIIQNFAGFRLYNISSGIGTSLVNITEHIYKNLKKERNYLLGERRVFDLPYNVLLNDKASRQLGWSPQHSLEKGLEIYLSSLSMK